MQRRVQRQSENGQYHPRQTHTSPAPPKFCGAFRLLSLVDIEVNLNATGKAGRGTINAHRRNVKNLLTLFPLGKRAKLLVRVVLLTPSSHHLIPIRSAVAWNMSSSVKNMKPL